MLHRIVFSLTLAASFAPALAPQTAFAQPADVAFTLSAGGRYLDLPNVKAGLSAPSTPQGKTPDPVGWGLDAGVGLGLDAPLHGVGDRARALFRARVLLADDRDREDVGAYGQVPVDGSGTSNGGSGSFAVSRVDYARFDIDALYEVAFGERWLARVGPSYGHSEQELAFFGSPFNGFRIDDEIVTHSYGLVVGGGIRGHGPFGVALSAARWKRPPIAWQAAKAQLAIQFGERFTLED